MSKSIKIDNISKFYGSFQAPESDAGGFLTILGSGGSGSTTLLKIIADAGTAVSEDAQEIDLNGRLVCEPCCDPHIHPDYVFTAASFGENSTGTLFDGIASRSDSKSTLTPEIIKERTKKGLLEQLLGGTQYIRTHVDVTGPKLTGLKAMLELREEVKDYADIRWLHSRRKECTHTRAARRLWRRL